MRVRVCSNVGGEAHLGEGPWRVRLVSSSCSEVPCGDKVRCDEDPERVRMDSGSSERIGRCAWTHVEQVRTEAINALQSLGEKSGLPPGWVTATDENGEEPKRPP